MRACAIIPQVNHGRVQNLLPETPPPPPVKEMIVSCRLQGLPVFHNPRKTLGRHGDLRPGAFLFYGDAGGQGRVGAAAPDGRAAWRTSPAMTKASSRI